MRVEQDVLRFFHPAVPSWRLRKKPKKITIAGKDYVLWRDGNGKANALLDACPHRNAPLSLGRVREDGRIACPYHGWSFSGDGTGCAPSQPDLTCTANALQVVERHDYVWIASPKTPLNAFPELNQPGFTLSGNFQTYFRAPLHIALDNFTEDEHFPYVHSFLGWEEKDWPDVLYQASVAEDHTTATYIGPQKPSRMLPILGLRSGDIFHNTFTSYFDPVRTIYKSHWIDAKSGKQRALEAITVVFMVPETDTTTRFHTFLLLNLRDGGLLKRLAPLTKQIAKYFVMLEWQLDARWVAKIAKTAPSLEGLRLGKFDKTVIRNRKLLEQRYFGNKGADIVSLPATAERR